MMIVKRTEKLLARYVVTEWKDGAIYKTRYVCEEWVPMNVETYKVNEDGSFHASLSTKRQLELGFRTIRTVAV
jgi:hypothetical protein